MKEEHRGVLAIVLSMAVLGFWYFVYAPKTPPAPPPAPEKPATLSEEVPSPRAEMGTAVREDSSREAGDRPILENELVRITLNSIGGTLESWELKKYTRNGDGAKDRVQIVEEKGGALDLEIRKANAAIPFPIPFKIVKKSERELVFAWRSPEASIWKRFSLLAGDYRVRMEVEIQNNKKETLTLIPTLPWAKTPSEETPQRGVLFFKSPPDIWRLASFSGGKFETTPKEKLAILKETPGPIAWTGAESRYFIGVMAAEGKGASVLEMSTVSPKGDKDYLSSRLVFGDIQILPGERWIQKFNVYGGPKELSRLEGVGAGMDQAIGYGWTRVIAVPILHLLQFFHRLVHSYGIAIILLTILVKLLLHPINKKSMQSMKAMQALQPKIQELKKKYGRDKQQLNLQMMHLFKAHKINPMGGCLPMLLQFPIYIALYKVFWSAVELYHSPFGFYKDLSAPDPYLITPLLLGVAMFFQTRMTPSATADPTQKKMMMLMPVMFCVIMLFMPVGLGLYILVNTVMTVFQQWMYNKGLRLRDVLRGRLAAVA